MNVHCVPVYVPRLGRFQLLARWPGTHSRILSQIQRAAQTFLGVYLKRTCSRVTNASSALGVLDNYALYKSTHSPHSLQLKWCQNSNLYKYKLPNRDFCYFNHTNYFLFNVSCTNFNKIHSTGFAIYKFKKLYLKTLVSSTVNTHWLLNELLNVIILGIFESVEHGN